MAITRITALTAQTGANVVATDQFVVVDVSDTTQDPTGTTKKIAASEVDKITGTLTNKTLDSFTNLIEADTIHIQVRNDSGSTIAAGTPVYVTGYNSGLDLITVGPADASVAATMPAIGLAETSIANGASGAVDRTGRLTGLNTAGFSVGDLLYVSETTGALTNVRPAAPALTQQVAEVVRSHASQGVLDVNINDVLFAASTTVVGGVELATTAETTTGTDTERAVTPAGLLNATTASNINARVAVKKAGSLQGTRRGINFIEGSGVTITTADDSGNEEVDVTIAASGGGGSVATDVIFDAKGDLPVGTGADTAAKLTAGTNGFALVADSSTSSGLAWKLHSNRWPTPTSSAGAPYAMPADSSGHINSPVSNANTANVLVFHPFFLERTRTLAGIILVPAALVAGATVRCGVYDATTWNAPTLITDYGTADLSTGGTKEILGSTVLRGGWYYVAAYGSNHGTYQLQGYSTPLNWLGPAPGTGSQYYSYIISGVDYSAGLPASPSPSIDTTPRIGVAMRFT